MHPSRCPCNIFQPLHSLRCAHPNNIYFKAHIMELHIIHFYPPHLGPNILLNILFTNTLSLCFSLRVWDPFDTHTKHQVNLPDYVKCDVTIVQYWYLFAIKECNTPPARPSTYAAAVMQHIGQWRSNTMWDTWQGEHTATHVLRLATRLT